VTVFISVFNQSLTPDSFEEICAAYTEIAHGNCAICFAKRGRFIPRASHPIWLDELQDISMRRFNTKEKMDRFDEIGEEIATLLSNQYPEKKIWSVEYARRHRDEFIPLA